MKTSNIIIIAFAIFILAGMLILFVDSKQHKKKSAENISLKEFALPAFSVVVAEKGSDLHLNYSDSTFIEVEYLKDKPVPEKIYKISNDTLYVYGGLRTFVKCKEVKTFVGNNAKWTGITSSLFDSLTVKISGGWLQISNNSTKETEKQDTFKHLSIYANTGYVNIQNLNLENLSLVLDSALVDINSYAKFAQIKLSNNAKVNCFNKLGTLTVEKDSTSEFRAN